MWGKLRSLWSVFSPVAANFADAKWKMGTSGECHLYQSECCHHLLLLGREKFQEGVTHLVLHTICPITPISEQSASAVMWTHPCSNRLLVQSKGVSMLQTCCFPVLNTHLNPSSIIHTHYVQQIDKHAGEEDLMLQRQRSVIRDHQHHLDSHCVTSESNLLPVSISF